MYCLKCKAKRDTLNPVETITTRGMKILKGKCGICGTTCCKMLGKKTNFVLSDDKGSII